MSIFELVKRYGIIFFLLFASQFVLAQNDSLSKPVRQPRACEIKLFDGSAYKGYIQQQSDSVIILKSSSGVVVQIPKKQVAEIDFLKEHSQKDTINFSHLHTIPSVGRKYYVTTSNAMLFRKKELWGNSSYFLAHNINYAFNQHFALGVATSVIGAPMGLTAKANFELGHKFYMGLEGVAGTLMYLGPNTYGGGGVAKFTFGDEHRNYTFYAGYFDLEYWVPKRRGKSGRPLPSGPGNYYRRYSSPFAGVAASLNLTPRMNFVCDVFAFPNISIFTGSVALRTVSARRTSFVFGFQVIGNMSTNVNRSFVLPYFGFGYTL